MITFDIPFNEKIFLEQIKLRFKLVFKKSYKAIRNLGITGLVLLSIGLIAGIDDKDYLNPFTTLGIIWLTLDILIGLTLFIIQRRAMNSENAVIKEVIENKYESHYEFSDDGIKFSNKIQQLELKWDGVKGYTIVNENIFIMLSKSIDHSLIIGKKEINEDNYEKIVELLKTKVKYIETK